MMTRMEDIGTRTSSGPFSIQDNVLHFERQSRDGSGIMKSMGRIALGDAGEMLAVAHESDGSVHRCGPVSHVSSWADTFRAAMAQPLPASFMELLGTDFPSLDPDSIARGMTVSSFPMSGEGVELLNEIASRSYMGPGLLARLEEMAVPVAPDSRGPGMH